MSGIFSLSWTRTIVKQGKSKNDTGHADPCSSVFFFLFFFYILREKALTQQGLHNL